MEGDHHSEEKDRKGPKKEKKKKEENCPPIFFPGKRFFIWVLLKGSNARAWLGPALKLRQIFGLFDWQAEAPGPAQTEGPKPNGAEDKDKSSNIAS